MLGWKILKEGEYKIDLPQLSKEEEQAILATEEKFRNIAGEKRIEPLDVEHELSNTIMKNAEECGFIIDSEQKEYLTAYAKMHIYGFAFLDELVKKENVEEISIIGIGKPAYVFIRKKGWQKVNAVFEDEKTLMDVINKMARGIGRRITLQHPRLDAILPDGSRLHASLHPISQGEITIRKFRERPFSPKEIVELGTIDYKSMAFLSLLMQTDSSVIIAGNTASGKTTTLNALFTFVPKNERVLVTEETPEINIPHEHQLNLIANKDMEISLKDLVYDSLRMRPDRMIVGEVRNKEEVEALFDVLLGGQARGAYATFHAQSAEEALLRLKKFGILEMDLQSIDAVIIQKRMLVYDKKTRATLETRKIVEIVEIGEKLKKIISFSNGRWNYTEGKLIKKIAQEFGINTKELRKELDEREKWIKNSKMDFNLFFKDMQKKFYKL